MRLIQCVRSLAKTYGLGIYMIMLPSCGFSVAHRRIRGSGGKLDENQAVGELASGENNNQR